MLQQKRSSTWNTALSVLLIALGVLFLLDTLNIIRDTEAVFLAGIFGVGAVISFGYYTQNRHKWWMLLPTGFLTGLGGFFALDAMPLLRQQIDEVGFMLAIFALTFWVIFFTEKQHKWAVFPAGFFSFVAVITTVNQPEIFIGLLFGAGALLGFRHYLKHRQRWWILFPSSLLLGISGVLILDTFHLRRFDEGSLMLFALALGFWLIYVTQRKHWWAGIPAGLFTTIAFLVALNSLTYGLNFEGPFIMLGFGLTFFMLWSRRRYDGTGWAIWPAAMLAGIGLLIPVASYVELLWPLLFIGAGVWMIQRNRLLQAGDFAQNQNLHKVE
jgi:hypothetical protein